MTWILGGFGGGETRDALIEGCNTVDAPILGAGWDIITSPTKNGTGAIRIPAGQAGSAVLLDTLADTNTPVLRINCMQAWVNYNGNPAAAHILMGMDNYTEHVGWLLEVGTDRRVRIVTHADNIPVTPWSEAVLGNGAWTHLVWILDPVTLGGHQWKPPEDATAGTNHTWCTVIIDDVVQISADLGPWSYYLAGITAYGFIAGDAAANVDIRLDDICGFYSTSASDAPHLLAAPIAKVAAQHPISDMGCSLTWTRFTGTNDWYTYWDEATGNDGDTTYLGGGQECLQTSLFESAATLGWGGSAVILEQGAGVGPVWSAVYRSIASGTKWVYTTYCDLANNVTLADPGTTYVGVLKRLTRTSGSWADDDLGTLKAGGLGGTTVDRPCAITTLMLQWTYYDTTLSLTPAPMIPQSCIF